MSQQEPVQLLLGPSCAYGVINYEKAGTKWRDLFWLYADAIRSKDLVVSLYDLLLIEDFGCFGYVSYMQLFYRSRFSFVGCFSVVVTS